MPQKNNIFYNIVSTNILSYILEDTFSSFCIVNELHKDENTMRIVILERYINKMSCQKKKENFYYLYFKIFIPQGIKIVKAVICRNFIYEHNQNIIRIHTV